jgi:hypothetical protein
MLGIRFTNGAAYDYSGGSSNISPSGVITVNSGATLKFGTTVGIRLSSVGGTCGGTLSNGSDIMGYSTFTTKAITANCKVLANIHM